MRCDACAERIDLFMQTWDCCVSAGFLQRSSAAQACSAELVRFCVCRLQPRQRDQERWRVVWEIAFGIFPYRRRCTRTQCSYKEACRPMVALRAQAGRRTRPSRGRSPRRMFMPGSARPADGMPKPLRIQTLRSASFAQRQTHRCLHLGKLAGEASGRMTSNQM